MLPNGFKTTDAEDLTQEFFALWLAKDNFAKPDAAKGRFRDLLQASLRRFLANAVRARKAKRRMPIQGFVSLQALADGEGPVIEPSQDWSACRQTVLGVQRLSSLPWDQADGMNDGTNGMHGTNGGRRESQGAFIRLMDSHVSHVTESVMA